MPAHVGPISRGFVLLCLLVGGAEVQAAPDGPGEWTGFTISRAAPAARIVVGRETTFVLRADRDVTGVRIALEPARGDAAGSWRARLRPLPPTEEAVPPDWSQAARLRPIWERSGPVAAGGKYSTTQRAGVPRRLFKSWALTLSPQGEGARPVVLQVRAGLVDPVARARWLMQMRAHADPEHNPEAIRQIIRHLTDQEVGHWAGMASRRIFLLAWRRMSAGEITAAFGAEEPRHRWPPHLLPNGVHLLVNGILPTRYQDIYPPDAVPPGTSSSKQTGTVTASAPAVPDKGVPEIRIGANSPVYHTDLQGQSGERQMYLRLGSEVRSVAVRLAAVPPAGTPPPYSLSIECVDPAQAAGPPAQRVFHGAAGYGQAAPPDRTAARLQQAAGRFPVFRTAVSLSPRHEGLLWLVRLRTLPGADGKSLAPLGASLRIEADARPVTARERELMAWRDSVDPLAQPDAVREQFATLSDEEVRYYTGFKTRALFLKHWMRTRRTDLPIDEKGRRVISSEFFPLLGKGMGAPLPNGKFLHHNGDGVPF